MKANNIREWIYAMGWFLIFIVILLFILGCSNARVSTPPWSQDEIEKLKTLKVETAPLCLVEISN